MVNNEKWGVIYSILCNHLVYLLFPPIIYPKFPLFTIHKIIFTLNFHYLLSTYPLISVNNLFAEVNNGNDRNCKLFMISNNLSVQWLRVTMLAVCPSLLNNAK